MSRRLNWTCKPLQPSLQVQESSEVKSDLRVSFMTSKPWRSVARYYACFIPGSSCCNLLVVVYVFIYTRLVAASPVNHPSTRKNNQLYNAGTFYGTKPHCMILLILSHCTITVTEIVPSLRRQLSSSVRRQSRAIAPASLYAPPAATSSPVCGSPPERSRGSSHLQTSFSRDFLAAPDQPIGHHGAGGVSPPSLGPTRPGRLCCTASVAEKHVARLIYAEARGDVDVCRWMAPPALLMHAAC